MPEKRCPGCRSKFYCGSGTAKEHCWCADLPPLMPVPAPEEGCWCPVCLDREIALRRTESPVGRPAPEPPPKI